jgi:hypothetical protein
MAYFWFKRHLIKNPSAFVVEGFFLAPWVSPLR